MRIRLQEEKCMGVRRYVATVHGDAMLVTGATCDRVLSPDPPANGRAVPGSWNQVYEQANLRQLTEDDIRELLRRQFGAEYGTGTEWRNAQIVWV